MVMTEGHCQAKCRNSDLLSSLLWLFFPMSLPFLISIFYQYVTQGLVSRCSKSSFWPALSPLYDLCLCVCKCTCLWLCRWPSCAGKRSAGRAASPHSSPKGGLVSQFCSVPPSLLVGGRMVILSPSVFFMILLPLTNREIDEKTDWLL